MTKTFDTQGGTFHIGQDLEGTPLHDYALPEGKAVTIAQLVEHLNAQGGPCVFHAESQTSISWTWRDGQDPHNGAVVSVDFTPNKPVKNVLRDLRGEIIHIQVEGHIVGRPRRSRRAKSDERMRTYLRRRQRAGNTDLVRVDTPRGHRVVPRSWLAALPTAARPEVVA